VTGAKGFLATCVLAVGSWVGTTSAWAADQLIVPAGARVGIIVMMPADATHYHVGKSERTSFMRTYRFDWSVAEVADDPIAGMLRDLGLEPVFLDPTELLRRQRQAWIISNRLANKLPRAAEDEIGRILQAENLQGLVIVAPGANSNPDFNQGDRLRKLPSYVQGWGFATGDDADGARKPLVFNLTQMLLIGRRANEPELIYREWGGTFVNEWPGFEPGADLKALPAGEVSKFRPVLGGILQQQIGRLAPRIKVAG
jgi:hypothetical protein